MPTRTRYNTDPIFLRREAELALQAIAPDDLQGMPCYVILESETGDGAGCGTRCDGWTSSCADLLYRDAIGPRWRGRGPAVVVSDQSKKSYIESYADDPFVRDVLFMESFRSTALHEFAHVLSRERLIADPPDPTPDGIAGERRRNIEKLESDDPVSGQGARIPFGNDHAWNFIRIAAHLKHRARLLGYWTHVDLAAGEPYSLSPFSDYLEALGDEPERLAAASFAEIKGRPLPAAFVELWESDLRKWITGQTNLDETIGCLSRDIDRYAIPDHLCAGRKPQTVPQRKAIGSEVSIPRTGSPGGEVVVQDVPAKLQGVPSTDPSDGTKGGTGRRRGWLYGAVAAAKLGLLNLLSKGSA